MPPAGKDFPVGENSGRGGLPSCDTAPDVLSQPASSVTEAASAVSWLAHSFA